jgi:hypothetical protein
MSECMRVLLQWVDIYIYIYIKGLKKNSQVYKVSKCRDKTDRKYKVARVSYSMVNRVKERK